MIVHDLLVGHVVFGHVTRHVTCHVTLPCALTAGARTSTARQARKATCIVAEIFASNAV